MVTETTTGSEPDDPLLAIQSPGNKTNSHIKVQARDPRRQNDNETRHRGICLNHLKQRIQKNFLRFPCTYTGEPIKVLSMFNAEIKCEEQQYSLPLLVVDGHGPWLQLVIFSHTGLKEYQIPKYRTR